MKIMFYVQNISIYMNFEGYGVDMYRMPKFRDPRMWMHMPISVHEDPRKRMHMQISKDGDPRMRMQMRIFVI